MSNEDKGKILIVDDLPEKLLVLETVLEPLGQTVVTALSGREALRHVLENDFAVILLDVNMPDMDGYETAALIRRRKRSAHTPIIFITAYADEMHTAQGYALGAVDYLLTPIIPDVLRTKVSVFVELYRKSDHVRRQAEQRITLAREQAARFVAEESVRRVNFLSEASKALGSSLDYDATLRSLLHLVVPRQADVGLITLVNDNNLLNHAEAAWSVDSSPPVIHAIRSGDELHPTILNALERVFATGEMEQLAATELGAPAAAHAEGNGNSAPHVSLASGVVLPLLARGRTLGALLLAISTSKRVYDGADLIMAQELAGRAATAIDNARLYRDLQEADRRKNQFLSMLAHELRNPLAPILNGVLALQTESLSPDQGASVTEMIERQARHLARMVDDLLDISRITEGKIRLHLETVSLAKVVQRALEVSEPLIAARRQELKVSLPQEDLTIEADPVRLAQVLSNLLNNAAKFTPDGGHIGLTVERDGDDVCFKVSDTGIGIPPEMLASIFDLFTQVEATLDRSHGGLGIGLTLVRRLVELHGGSVRAFSPGRNQGSEFVVRLPRHAEILPAPQPDGQTRPTFVGRQRRILVIDDNVDAADSLAMLLRVAGHEVQTAKDGPTALSGVSAFQPEVALVDIGLPIMDGYEVARHLRQELHSGLLLIALTGYGQKEDFDRSRKAGFDHHLIKPTDPGVLMDLMAR